MFKDVNLPEDESWAAMTKDLRTTKDARNALTKEVSWVIYIMFVMLCIYHCDSVLKRKLAEAELKRDEYVSLLKTISNSEFLSGGARY